MDATSPNYPLVASAPPTGAATATALNSNRHRYSGLISGKAIHITDAGAVGEATGQPVDADTQARRWEAKPHLKGCEEVFVNALGLEVAANRRSCWASSLAGGLVEGSTSARFEGVGRFAAPPPTMNSSEAFHQSPACCDGARASGEISTG